MLKKNNKKLMLKKNDEKKEKKEKIRNYIQERGKKKGQKKSLNTQILQKKKGMVTMINQ